MCTQPVGTPGALELHMLCGTRHVADLLYAAKSFICYYPEQVSLVVHGDHSFTRADQARINEHLPNATVYLKAVRDGIIELQLRRRNLQGCLQFRRLNPFGAKLIDAPLLSRADRICLLDSDCIAFSALTELHSAVQGSDNRWIFAADVNDYPYSVSPAHAVELFGAPLPPALCAGFAVIRPADISLDEIDAWLRSEDYPLQHHFAEQTIYAAVASRAGYITLPPTRYNTGRTIAEDDACLIHYCGHYLSKTRLKMRSEGQKRLLSVLSRR